MPHRFRSVLALACLAGLTALCAASSAPLKVAFVYLGPIADGGWTYQHNLGRLALEREFGARLETTYIENVPETADAERVIRQLAARDYAVIFATSFGYMEPTLKVAKLFPKVKFEHATGYKTAANVVTYQGRSYEGAYLLGVLAGRMTKTNTLGYIGSFPIPEVIRNIDAFTLGARSVNPRIHTRVIWVDTWYDPGKERQAAEALIAQGADILCQNTDSPAAVQVAEEKGIYAVRLGFGHGEVRPACATDRQHRELGRVLHRRNQESSRWLVDRRSADTLGHQGGRRGAHAVECGGARRRGATVRNAQAGDQRRHPAAVCGPDQGQPRRTVKVAADASLSIDELMAIDWYVEGVDGSVP